MKAILINIVLIALVLLFAGLTFKQCSEKKSERKLKETALAGRAKSDADYLELAKAKTRIDTMWKEGKTVTKRDTTFLKDTAWIENGKEYGQFKWSIDSADLKFKATVTASDLRAIDYTYSVREKIITQQPILTVHDTLIQQVRKGQLIGLFDIGLHSYSAGLQYQSRKRIGFTVGC